MREAEFMLNGEEVKHVTPAKLEYLCGKRFSVVKAVELMRKGHILSCDWGSNDYYIMINEKLYGYASCSYELEEVSVEEMSRMFMEQWYYIA